jgi:hypothetical protein
MKIKTAYRTNSQAQFPAEKIAETIPPSEKFALDAEPAADAVTVRYEPDAPPSAAVTEAVANSVKADEATLRLQHQLAELQHSEQLQRQAMMTPQQPMSRGQLLQAWKRGGMSEAEERFLAEHPAMIDHHQLTAVAAQRAAQQGHERGSEAHRQATKEIFDQQLARLQAQAQPAPQPAPEFFQPPPPPPSTANIYSAPVSREVPSGGYREQIPSRVTLSPQELEIAATSKITPTEYARLKLKMLREQASGDRQR